MKSLIRTTFFFIFLVRFFYSYAQDIHINPAGRLFEIMHAPGQSIAFLGFESAALYQPELKIELPKDPEAYHNSPELLALGFFNLLREGSLDAFLSLYDPASREIISHRMNYTTARESFRQFESIEFLSLFSFGNYRIIRFNMKGNSQELMPWVLNILLTIENRYYITETLPEDDAFCQLTSAHPWNIARDPLKVKIKKLPLLKISFTPFPSAQVSNLGTYKDSLYIALFVQPIGDFSGKEGVLGIMGKFFHSMKDSLPESFTKLWANEEQERFSSSEFDKAQVEVQKSFYRQADSIRISGVIESVDEVVVFYKTYFKGKSSALQIMPLLIEEGELRLEVALKSLTAWNILIRQDVLQALDEYLSHAK